MNAAQDKQRRDAVARHIYERVQKRARRKGCGVKRLADKGARDAVLNGAAWRLMQADSVLPYKIRRRLHPPRLGNIGLFCSISPLLWEAWQQVHRNYIENGNFWFEESVAHDKLIDRALAAEYKAYTRALKNANGGVVHIHFSDVEHRVARKADEPMHLEEQEQDRLEAETAEDAADEARRQEAAKEFDVLKEALADYSDTLRLAHRKALWFVVNEPQLTNSTVVAKVAMRSVRGISPLKVSQIRDHFVSLAARFLELMYPEDAALADLVALKRRVEAMETEMRVMRAERRRDEFLRNHSVEELAELRAWAAPFYEALGRSVDDLISAAIVPKERTA